MLRFVPFGKFLGALTECGAFIFYAFRSVLNSLQVVYHCIILIRSLVVIFFSPFQAMIIMACHDLESPLQVFDADVFEDIMSIFITSAILKLIQGRGTCSYFTHY